MPKPKKHEMLGRMKERTANRPSLLADDVASTKKGYRMMGVSLYTPEAEWVDHLVRVLKHAGIRRANRSLVIQQLLLLGQEHLNGKDEAEVTRFFRERIAKRL
jgi:hypothetical protein